MAKKKTILVIDDTESILDAMSEILKLEGFTVCTAATEDEVHEIIEEKNILPDLILLDVLLSGQDGRVIAQYMKSDPKTKNIPIVMMSAHPDVSKTVAEAGADGFIPKPFEIGELLSTINKFL